MNVHAEVGGLAGYPGVHQDLVFSLIRKGYGLIQKPCPELGYFGIQGWGKVVEQMDIPAYHRHCRVLLQPVVDLVHRLSTGNQGSHPPDDELILIASQG